MSINRFSQTFFCVKATSSLSVFFFMRGVIEPCQQCAIVATKGLWSALEEVETHKRRERSKLLYYLNSSRQPPGAVFIRMINWVHQSRYFAQDTSKIGVRDITGQAVRTISVLTVFSAGDSFTSTVQHTNVHIEKRRRRMKKGQNGRWQKSAIIITCFPSFSQP